ncbi:uncharacterized protein LOC143826625 [Paroedura picta]|uniref:uncharacterized protein LOC143826625 n=1 Tax=Paroedura picta TaxID=143630 RepID=UPI004056645A
MCSKPIMDRILRTMGKVYHSQCFTCIVCHCCLDRIPFTVDATSQIHCIEDFHRKFAPWCSMCGNTIMLEPGQEETVRIVALTTASPSAAKSVRAMSIMNSFVNDIFERIAGEASSLAHYNKHSTITSREIQTAVHHLLPGELAKDAVSEGTKAVTKYTSSKSGRGRPKPHLKRKGSFQSHPFAPQKRSECLGKGCYKSGTKQNKKGLISLSLSDFYTALPYASGWFTYNIILNTPAAPQLVKGKTVTAMDVVYALKRQGCTLSGFSG